LGARAQFGENKGPCGGNKKTGSSARPVARRRRRRRRRPLTTAACLYLPLAQQNKPTRSPPPSPLYQLNKTKTVDPDPNTLPKGDGPLYASAAQIYSAMDRWSSANPRLFTVYRAVDPVSGESFPVGRLTDSQAPSSKKKRVLITCAVHARELIVPEVCLNVLRLLAAPLSEKAPVLAWSETTAALRKAGIAVRPTTPISGGSTMKRDPLAPYIAAFAQSYDLHVAPLINLSGRMLIEQGGKFSQRKTANGVDINRNFPFGWSDANKDVKSETYPGPYPASQWEVREGRGTGVIG
jgi:hypothetical protein